MRAIVYSEYGPPDVLRLEERPVPTPRAHEIRIRVRAAEATKSDCELRSFRFPVRWFWLPLRLALGVRRPRNQVLGGYFSGEVDTIGSGVTRFRPGDEVYGATGLRFGAYGEYVCVPDHYPIARKPANLSFEEAAAVPLGGLNALHFMRLAAVRADDRVLVNGAGGSIGTFGVQIAKSQGAHVTAVDRAIKHEMLRRIGADEVVDHETTDFTASGVRYAVIFDMVARSSYSRCLATLRPGGRYLMANPRVSDMLRSVVTTRFTDKQARFAFARETTEELDTLRQMIEEGQIAPAVDGVYPMEQAAEAHRRVETEERRGPVVIAVGPARAPATNSAPSAST